MRACGARKRLSLIHMLSVVLVFVLSFTFNLHGCDLSICYHLVHDSIVSVPFCVQFSVPSGVPVDVPA